MSSNSSSVMIVIIHNFFRYCLRIYRISILMKGSYSIFDKWPHTTHNHQRHIVRHPVEPFFS